MPACNANCCQRRKVRGVAARRSTAPARLGVECATLEADHAPLLEATSCDADGIAHARGYGGSDAGGLPGAYRMGAWYASSSNFADQRYDNAGLSLASPLSTGIPAEHTGDSGVYGMIDQMLYRLPGTDDHGLSPFSPAGGVPHD